MAIEIVDSPIQNVNFPQQTVSLPEVIHSTDLHLTSSRPLIRVPHHRSSSRLPPGRMPRSGLRRFNQGGTPYTFAKFVYSHPGVDKIWTFRKIKLGKSMLFV